MKKYIISVVLGFILLPVLSSCFHLHDTSISISEEDDEYEMGALYKKNKTHKVQVYLNNHLLKNRVVSFKSESTNEEITLDDNTTIYVNSYPGNLTIKIDKTKNTEESCKRVRQICEELKDILADN